MQSDRRGAIITIPILLLFLSCAAACRWIIIPPENLEQFLWAVPIGGAIGFLVCLYLYIVWDPKTLTSKGQRWRVSGCLLPFAVIGGIIFAGITASILPYNASELLPASLGIAFYMMFIYLWVQTFRYRHYRND